MATGKKLWRDGVCITNKLHRGDDTPFIDLVDSEFRGGERVVVVLEQEFSGLAKAEADATRALEECFSLFALWLKLDQHLLDCPRCGGKSWCSEGDGLREDAFSRTLGFLNDQSSPTAKAASKVAE